MTLQSMTGFARHAARYEAAGKTQAGATDIGEARITWEVRSVNGKGLDLRLRLPQGFEAVEHPVRSVLARHFAIDGGQARRALFVCCHHYPFTPPLVRPEIRARCMKSPTSTGGRAAITPAVAISP